MPVSWNVMTTNKHFHVQGNNCCFHNNEVFLSRELSFFPIPFTCFIFEIIEGKKEEAVVIVAVISSPNICHIAVCNEFKKYI